jgi:hypothetical protein
MLLQTWGVCVRVSSARETGRARLMFGGAGKARRAGVGGEAARMWATGELVGSGSGSGSGRGGCGGVEECGGGT